MTVSFTSFQRKLESSFSFAHHVMAGPLVPGLDPGINPAISCQRQMRGSSPPMTYYKSVMAGLDPAISAGISFSPPCGEGRLSEAKTGWGFVRQRCTPTLPSPTRGEGKFLLDSIPIIG